MKRWTAITLLAVAFLLGMVVGGLGTELLHLRRIAAWHHRGGGPPGFGFLMHHLERRLELSPEQARQVDEILDRARRDLSDMHREVRPRIHRRLGEARSEIEEVLTPEQREELRRLGPRLLPPGHHRHDPPRRHDATP
ncbi:MAG: hypothetical protein ACRD2Z_04915 [Thermoanaerobaculia bacterium]